MMRPTVESDAPQILSLAASFFTAAEVACVQELLELYLHKPGQRDYSFLCYEDGGQVVGFACYGPTPLTESTYSLYWICVQRPYRHHGIGGALLAEVESRIARQGGRLLVAETSSTPQYAPARRFYAQHGFQEAARIRDFYAIADDLIIYSKQEAASPAQPDRAKAARRQVQPALGTLARTRRRGRRVSPHRSSPQSAGV